MSQTTASAKVQGSASPLRSERPRAGVLRLTLANPPANALSEAMLDALQAALKTAAVDPEVRVVVIAAEGKLFSGGHDLKQMTKHRSDRDTGRGYFEDVFAQCSAMMQAIVALPK